LENSYQFFLLNDAALEACKASNVHLRVIGSVEGSKLTARPTILLRLVLEGGVVLGVIV